MAWLRFILIFSEEKKYKLSRRKLAKATKKREGETGMVSEKTCPKFWWTSEQSLCTLHYLSPHAITHMHAKPLSSAVPICCIKISCSTVLTDHFVSHWDWRLAAPELPSLYSLALPLLEAAHLLFQLAHILDTAIDRPSLHNTVPSLRTLPHCIAVLSVRDVWYSTRLLASLWGCV